MICVYLLKNNIVTIHTNSSTSINNKEGNNMFILPSFRTNIGRASLAYQGIKLWNKEIPETSFSKELKQHLLERNNLILRND